MKVMGALWLYIGMSKSCINTVYNTMVKIPVNLMVLRIPDILFASMFKIWLYNYYLSVLSWENVPNIV